jgi:CDP-glucose 4,6-dehydratase
MEIDFWKSRRVFITGHTGFKGSWLAFWLISMGADVCGYSLEPITTPNLYEALKLDREMRSVIADIRDLASLEFAMLEFKPDVVIHMAAQSLVRFSYENPVETYAVNVMGTVHVLDAVRRVPSVRAVVCVTSDKCYENREWVWPYREDEAMGGYDPYSSSKGCAELVTAAYRRSYFHPDQFATHKVVIGSGRAGNVIGGGDWARDRLVPDVVRAFASGETVTVRNPNAVRPWQHVLEPLAGYLTLAEHLWAEGVVFQGGWNFGPADSDAQPVRHVVSEMSRLWGKEVPWQVADEVSLHEAHLLRLDSSKARARLGWRPRWKLEDALVKTVQWYRAFYDGQDVRSLTLDQIQAFTSLEES